jgi:hypothetical protein
LTLATTRPLTVTGVSDTHNHYQFAGDGTAAHPPLYDRDVLGFFPFQVTDSRFAIPVYVMTRNVAKLYRPDAPASDTTRYDMPPERFRLTIRGASGLARRISLRDPLTRHDGGVRIVGQHAGKLILDVALTDSPRLLVLSSSR